MIKIHNMAQCSPEWWDIRAEKITGSNFHRFMVMKDTWLDNAKKLIANDFRNEDFVETEDTRRGKRLEDEARRVYELKEEQKVHEVGFITNTVMDYIGVSPDGIVYNGNNIVGAVEIKCRNKDNFIKFSKSRKIKRSALMQIVCYFTVIDTLEWVDYVEYSEEVAYHKNTIVERVTREDVIEHINIAKKRLLILKEELKGE